MNPINKAIAEVFFNIPREVLNICFTDAPQGVVSSVDEAIMLRVIRPRVMVDCNLLGGIEINVDLSKCNVYTHGHNMQTEYLIEVPKTLTGNKSIVTPIGILGTPVRPMNGLSVNTPLTQALSDQMSIGVMPPVITTSRLELVGENKVLVTDPSMRIVSGSLKCVVENNENLSNISPRSYNYFSTMVVLAVKAYIYNSLVVKMGKGYIYNGHELSIVTDLINEYASANEDYNIYIVETWAKVALMNDRNAYRNIIAGMV